jgi:hypothetical protein
VNSNMDKKMTIVRSIAKRVSIFPLFVTSNKVGGPMSIQGEAVQAASICRSPSVSRKVAWTIVLCVTLGGIIANPATCHAQSPSESTPATSEKATESDVQTKQIRSQ